MEETDNISEHQPESPMSDWSDAMIMDIEKHMEVLDSNENNTEENIIMEDHINKSTETIEAANCNIETDKCYTAEPIEDSIQPTISEEVSLPRMSTRQESKTETSNVVNASDWSSDDEIPLARYMDVTGDDEYYDDDDNDRTFVITKDDINSSDSDFSESSKHNSSDSSVDTIRDRSWKKRGKHIKRKQSKVQKKLFPEDLKQKLTNAKDVARMKRTIPTKKDMLVDVAIARSKKDQHDRLIKERYHLNRLDVLLASNGLDRVHIEGDGDCFFNSVKCQIGEDISVAELRDIFASHMLENVDTYIPFLNTTDNDNLNDIFNQQIDRLRMNGSWKENLADCLPLAVANVYRRQIKIFSTNTANPVFDISPTITQPSGDTIYLAYVEIPGVEHYEGVQLVSRTNETDGLSNNRANNRHKCSEEDLQNTPSKQGTSVFNVTPHKKPQYQSPGENTVKRKKKSEPELWKKNVRKRNRAAGLPYISDKGKNVEGRTLRAVDCGKCKFKCQEKLTDSDRKHIFATYWQLQDYNRQRDFICQHVTASNTKRSKGHKSVSYAYYVSKGGEKIRVCRTFFLKTLAIGKKTVHIAIKKKSAGIFCGTDLRGKQKSANKTPVESIDEVRRHIESFPKMESHYTRQRTKRQYLAQDLSIKKMWHLYCEMCKAKRMKPVTEKKYRDIFCEEYNMSFFKPKKDQCSICTLYENHKMRGEVSDEIQTDYKDHQSRKVQAREEKERDKNRAKEDSSFHSATFDLQAVLSTPCSLIGELYYKRKLSCYNLSFYSLGDKNGTCYLWDETHGGRGSCEIATCLQTYINSVTSKCSSVKEITVYSDTCGGQNRNKFVASGLLHAINQKGQLEIINQKFFERGHSHMESDSIHSTIEHAKKNTEVFHPSQWHWIISHARKRKPYVVVPMKYSDFMNFKDLAKCQCPNMKFTTRGIRLNWLKIKWIQVRRSSPTSIFVNTNFDANNLQEVKVQSNATRGIGRPRQWPDILELLYERKLPVSTAKKADLISLCTTGIIPSEFHNYYQQLVTSKGSKDRLPLPDDQESDYDTDDD